MKPLLTICLLLVCLNVFSQTVNPEKSCTNGSLTLSLNTTDTVRIKVTKPYQPVQPTATSTVFSTNQISVTKTSDVDSYVPGIYKDCYTATDASGLTVTCCRIVIVERSSPTTNKINSAISPEIIIYPNPIKEGEFTILTNGLMASGASEVELIDIQGGTVFSTTYSISSNGILTISLENKPLDKGIYTLTIKQDTSFVNKLIVLN